MKKALFALSLAALLLGGIGLAGCASCENCCTDPSCDKCCTDGSCAKCAEMKEKGCPGCKAAGGMCEKCAGMKKK